eukprot:TRINITY_DN1234_c5_g1_i1.p1 TRINITY_DN1234_c5_g1~~TRINITY_DN1234_c5_g1_i1.p1  ORF type:complete len:297 (+),score=66.92 TRINITY_DN1234_c5_g1_i1:54-893(+)
MFPAGVSKKIKKDKAHRHSRRGTSVAGSVVSESVASQASSSDVTNVMNRQKLEEERLKREVAFLKSQMKRQTETQRLKQKEFEKERSSLRQECALLQLKSEQLQDELSIVQRNNSSMCTNAIMSDGDGSSEQDCVLSTSPETIISNHEDTLKEGFISCRRCQLTFQSLQDWELHCETFYHQVKLLDCFEEPTPPPATIDATRPSWTSDSEQSHCYGCSKRFTFKRRRHHCRHCGDIFCNDCTKAKALIHRMHYKKPVRVCKPCNAVILGQQLAWWESKQ